MWGTYTVFHQASIFRTLLLICSLCVFYACPDPEPPLPLSVQANISVIEITFHEGTEDEQKIQGILETTRGGNIYSFQLSPGTSVPTKGIITTLTISENAISSKIRSERIQFVQGKSSIIITAEDGTTKNTYSLNITVLKNTEGLVKEACVTIAGKLSCAKIEETRILFSLPSSTEIPETISFVTLSMSYGATSSIQLGDVLELTNGHGYIKLTSEDGSMERGYNVFVQYAQ